MVNALQTLSKLQTAQQKGRTGRTDEGDMMSYGQDTQARSQDLAQLEECDLTPMILRSLVVGRPFCRMPFLSPPDPVVQRHAKERVFLHGMLDTKGVTQMGQAVDLMTQQYYMKHGHPDGERHHDESSSIPLVLCNQRALSSLSQFTMIGMLRGRRS